MKYKALFVVLLLLASPMLSLADVDLGRDTIYCPDDTRTNYIMGGNFTFSYISVGSDYIEINGSQMSITNDSHWVDVTINAFKGYGGDELRNWTENCSTATANTSHVLQGYNNSAWYSLYIDNSFDRNLKSNTSGVIEFNYTGGFSSHDFLLLDGKTDISANFFYSPSNPEPDETVSFTDSSYSVLPISTYHWNFGDGSSGVGSNPTHSYNAVGTYPVQLTVTDTGGLSDSITKYVSVSNDTDNSDSDDDVTIPPVQPPIGGPYTIPEMYRLMGMDDQMDSSPVKIAVIDTGATHRTYSNEVDMTVDLSNIEMHSVSGYMSGLDDHGHGTFTSCEVYYATKFLPGLKVYSIKALNSEGTGSMEDIEQAIDLAKSLDVDVISMSFGATGIVGDKLDRMTRELAMDGIIAVASAGNSGPSSSTVTTPALSPRTLAIGALHPHSLNLTVDDRVTSWSSRGPVVGLDEVKPDMVAGGESIVGPAMQNEVVWSGTSLAAPLISGSIGYMLADNSNAVKWFDTLYWWDYTFNLFGLKQRLVEGSIEDSCTALTEGTENDYGHGLPDIPAASSNLHSELWFYIIIMLLIYVAVILSIVYAVYRYYRKRKQEDEGNGSRG